MPRKPRLHVPGGLYHVILRGNDRQTIFFDADDWNRWESLISAGLEKHKHRIHAYCWMPNHVHLAIQCHEQPLGGFMRFIAGQYARSTNKKMNRTGHLFERRHRAIPVQADSYLKELVRYIHQNPLRAGLVGSLTDFQCSSHLAYLGGIRPNWLTLNWVLSAFGKTPYRARRQYVRFMRTECQPSMLQQIRDCSDDDHRILGDDGFFASLEPDKTPPAPQQSLEQLAEAVCQKYDVSETALKSMSRDRWNVKIRAEIGLTAIRNGIASNAEIARYFNRNQSGISRSIDRLRKQRQQSK